MLDIKPYLEADSRIWDAWCNTDPTVLFLVLDDLFSQPGLFGIDEFHDRFRQLSVEGNGPVDPSYETAFQEASERVIKGHGSPRFPERKEFHRCFSYICAMIAFSVDTEAVPEGGVVATLIDRECPCGMKFDYKMRFYRKKDGGTDSSSGTSPKKP